jgi:membrane associated rhomboid family serine protease
VARGGRAIGYPSCFAIGSTMPFQLPPVTRNLLIANVAVYLLQMLLGDVLVMHFALWPWGPDRFLPTVDGLVAIGFRPWQLITYAFMHGGFQHIAFNMLALWMFGGPIERLFGGREFLLYYFVCLVVAALAQLVVVEWFTHGFYPTLGASGAVFGLLLAFGMMYPHEKVMLIFLPIPMPAWLFVIGYAAIELVLGVTGTQAGVAHFAHLGGMLGGYVLIQYWRGRLPLKPRRRLTR